MDNTDQFHLDHMFVIMAYKKSEFLEDCVKSLLNQTVSARIIMTTSTPNEFISDIARKYHIQLYIRRGKSDIRDDWNYAYNIADTEWVTLAHQDDLYDSHYLEDMTRKLRGRSKAIAYVTDYIPIKNGKIGPRDINSKIRHILRTPLKSRFLCGRKFWKRLVLCLGNSICCPAVSYNRRKLGRNFFTSDLKFCIDWDTHLKIANLDGEFVYLDKPLVFYRVYNGATSKTFIESHTREWDDLAMFRKFWPEPVARLILQFYKIAYHTYD